MLTMNEEERRENLDLQHTNAERSVSLSEQDQSTEHNCVKGKKPKTNGLIKKRGHSSKEKTEADKEGIPFKQTKVTDSLKKSKRTVNRFKGVTKEELLERLLPDRIKHDLDILIIGINPGLFAAYKGHHYAGPGNHFWDCINMSGLVEKPSSSENDVELLSFGIGFSTIVQRTTASSKELSSKEIREGGRELVEKIKTYRPKIAVFNGKGIYEIFSKETFGQKKKDFVFGRQPNKIPGTDTFIFVMPSSSARCAQFPRAQDKVHYFIQLKRLRDEIKGLQTAIDVVETDYTFDVQKATEMARIDRVKVEQHDPSYNDNVCPTIPSNTELLTTVVNNSQPNCSTTVTSCLKKITPSKARKKPLADGAAFGHPNLVKYLCQKDEPKPKAPAKSPSLKTRMPNLQEIVSEEQKKVRVGEWVQTQINQNYESEPPMGYEEMQRSGEVTDQPESDHGSQRSMISAGVSGSASTASTSGYGSVDNNPHYARQDRVEMWVREQQYVHQLSQAAERRRWVPLRPPDDTLAEQPTSSHVVDAWNSFALQQLPFSNVASTSAPSEGTPKPPVPLYSSWGGIKDNRVSPNLNENNVIVQNLGQQQLNVNAFIP